jgi:hypothetical protein
MTQRIYTVDDKKRACIVLVVLHYITVLNALDEETFWKTHAEWTEHHYDDPAWSEAFSYRIPGLTSQAFQSVCKKIACLAFSPGGVKMFGRWFMAKRQPSWCAWPIWDALGQQAYAVIREQYEQVQSAKGQMTAATKKQRSSKKKEAENG